MKLYHLLPMAAIALTSLSSAKDEPKPDQAAKVIELFDGKTLNGLKIVGGNGRYNPLITP